MIFLIIFKFIEINKIIPAILPSITYTTKSNIIIIFKQEIVFKAFMLFLPQIEEFLAFIEPPGKC